VGLQVRIASISEERRTHTLTVILRNPPCRPLNHAVADSYMQNVHIAFARDKKTKKYRHEVAYKQALSNTKNTFKIHPFYTAGIMSISNFYLNITLLPVWRKYLKEVAKNGVKVLVVYGDEDVVVPNLGTLSSIDNVECSTLKQQGHECFYEDTSTISPILAKFFSGGE
jgi:pimeloyl-ACP methyl ester carboxylesterase